MPFVPAKYHTGIILSFSGLLHAPSLHYCVFVGALGSFIHPHHQQGQGSQLESDTVLSLSLRKEEGNCQCLGG